MAAQGKRFAFIVEWAIWILLPATILSIRAKYFENLSVSSPQSISQRIVRMEKSLLETGLTEVPAEKTELVAIPRWEPIYHEAVSKPDDPRARSEGSVDKIVATGFCVYIPWPNRNLSIQQNPSK